MSGTVWTVLAVASTVIAALAVAWLARRLYVRQMRRSLVLLFGRREAVASAYRSFADLLARLAGADQEAWDVFVHDPESDDRRAVVELCRRMEVVASDLEVTRLPKSLHGIADGLEDAARGLCEEAAKIGEGRTPPEVLEGVGHVDLKTARERFDRVTAELDERLAAYGIADPSVYGGGFHL